MQPVKEIWNNKELRCGGFYELAIEVSSNEERESLSRLTTKLFQLDFVKGPFNTEFESVSLDLEYFDNLGFIEVEGKKVPFKTYNIIEEGEDGSNWLDISFYSGIYEEVFGKEYQTWAKEGKWHKGFDNCLFQILKELNSVIKIRIGLIGFEVSGMYNLRYLKERELTENDISHTKFFANKGILLNGKNWQIVKEI
jgi:hypothetical protein